MPRRLGDDPLARAKAAAQAEATTEFQASDSSRRATTRGSYNDVFFRRRGDAGGGPGVAKEVNVAEAPEITEISEIPEIREVAAAPAVEESPVAEARMVEPRTTTEEMVALPSAPLPVEKSDSVASSAPVAGPVASAAPVPLVESVNPLAAPQAPSQDEGKPKAEKEGGFFKRLFGKFGK